MMRLLSGRKAVAAAGTRERLSTDTVIAKKVYLQANSGNAGVVVAGGASVVAAEATREGLALLSTRIDPIDGPISLTDVWVDSTENDDQAHFSYLAE